MSRSRKKCIGGTRLVRTTCCSIGHRGLKPWRKRYNRAMRRKHVQQIHMIDLQNLEEDDTYLENDPELTKEGNSWTGPGDGWMKWNIDECKSWMPEYQALMK